MGFLSLIARFCQLRGEVLSQQAAGGLPSRLRRQGGKVVPRGGRGGTPGQQMRFLQGFGGCFGRFGSAVDRVTPSPSTAAKAAAARG